MKGTGEGEQKQEEEGKWHPLAEKFSPRERIQLLNVLTENIYQKSIAEACVVTPQAVSSWICKKGFYPGNEASVYLLKLDQRVKPEETARIVKNGIERYIDELEKIGIEIREDL
ncbi:hypothetical protein AKJ37_06920 [candidate division MSBL1 archaeon SCGC-AAA259I09]|uniref:Uncharacterized protein n=2 Tax=candidate division MSBL1 TaxID=215777 RepID=A0A133UM50_9EURY|nr:hypothetical protein AKJ37_06920 [candidate division MSBL1 archaeon SCGC-AAA259I09]KXA97991.1 hypothetical protein AKJ39_02710 [candidate division MSBL1 archaeon SCGC-AAA259J03]